MTQPCALALISFAIFLGSYATFVEPFGLGGASLPAAARRPKFNQRQRETHHHRLTVRPPSLSPTTEEDSPATDIAATEPAAKRGGSSLSRRDTLLQRSKRRALVVFRLRVRKLARLRRKKSSRRVALRVEENDVDPWLPAAVSSSDAATRTQQQQQQQQQQQLEGIVADINYPPEVGDQIREGPELAAAAEVAQQASSPKAIPISPESTIATEKAISLILAAEKDDDDAVHFSATAAAVAAGGGGGGSRRIRHRKRRNLWRFIFGPRLLLEVRSVKELSRLVDVEGWRLEDLSVFTPRSPGNDDGTGGGININSKPSKWGRKRRWRRGQAAALVTDGLGDSGSGGGGSENGVGVSTATAAVPHIAVQAVLDRAAAGTLPSKHGDGRRIGLAIEGGGMRGCVAAGMASCLHYLGLADSFDGVYGASAGSLVGAYFVSRQSNGTAVYHDVLPSAGSKFIDMAKFPQALGFKLPKVKIPGERSSSSGSIGSSMKRSRKNAEIDSEAARSAGFARVIGLDFLLDDVVGKMHALDFDTFLANNKLQPLHVVTSGVNSMSSVSLASRRGHFSTLEELTACIRASMLVPGLAGPLQSVSKGEAVDSAWAKDDHDKTPPLQNKEQQTAINNSDNDSDHRHTAASLSKRGRHQSNAAGVVGTFTASSPSWAMGEWRRPERPSEEVSRRRGEEEESKKGIREGVDGDVTAVAAAATAGEHSDHGTPATTNATSSEDTPELLSDALVFEPLPYRSAIDDGCTDVVVLCTRPKGSQVLGKKPSLYETRVVKRYFDQHEDPANTSKISEHVQELKHLRTYAEDALLLEEGSRTGLPQAAPEGGPGQGRKAFVVAVAPDASCKEVSQLTMDRKIVLQGCRDGFAACYDLFVGSAAAAATAAGPPTERETAAAEGGRFVADIAALTRPGAEVALEYFPDSILSIPVNLDSTYFEPGCLVNPPPSAAPSRRDNQGALGEKTYRRSDHNEKGSAGVTDEGSDEDRRVMATPKRARECLRQLLLGGKKLR